MPDRSYKLTYVVEDAGAVIKLKAIRSAVEDVNAAAMKGAAQIKAMDQALLDIGAQAHVAQMRLEKATDATNGLSHSIGGILPTWQVFEVGVNLVQTFGQYMNSAREHMRELAREAQDTRDKMRELANLKGHFGPDNQVVGETVKMGMEAGMTIHDATKFMEQFEGSVPAGREKGNINPDTEVDLAIEGMKFGNRVGLQPGTSGDIAGVLSQYGKVANGEQGAGQLGSIAYGLNAGRGNLEPLMRSLIKTAGSIVEEHGGPVEDLPQLAAMLGVASTNATPDRAGTMLKNGVNALRKFKGPQGETLKGLGISPEDKFATALGKIAPKILEADAAGVGGDTYLRSGGFGNEDEIRSLVQLSRNYKVFEARVAEAKKEGHGAKVMEDNANFLTSDRTGLKRSLNARNEGQKFLIGQSKEYAELGITAGQSKLMEEGWVGGLGNGTRLFAKNLGGWLTGAGFEEGATREAKGAFMQQLDKEAARVGVDPTRRFKVSKDKEGRDAQILYGTQLASHPADLFNDTEGLNALIEDILIEGGRPFGDNAKVYKKLDTLTAKDRDYQRSMMIARQQRQAQGKGGAQVPAGRRFLNPRGIPGPNDPGGAIPPAAGAAAGGAAPGPGADLGRKLDKLIAAAEKTNTVLDNKLASTSLPEGAGPVGAGRI